MTHNTVAFYNDIAALYDKWVQHDQQRDKLIAFYSEQLAAIDDSYTMVYLGVATGRLALDFIKRSSKAFIGVDSSKAMLRLAKQRFQDANVMHNVTLIEQDFTCLELAQTKKVLMLPFRTLSHFITTQEQRKLFASLYCMMRTGERFIFDLDHFNEKSITKDSTLPRLLFHEETSGEVIISIYNFSLQEKCVDAKLYHGFMRRNDTTALDNLRAYTYKSSWISPSAIAALLKDVGFSTVLNDVDAAHQMWVVEK